MTRAPYHFARSSALEDETYFRATELATRLLALTEGRRPILKRVRLTRAKGPSGWAFMVSTGGRPFGYILREGCDDLGERLETAITAAMARDAVRLAA